MFFGRQNEKKKKEENGVTEISFYIYHYNQKRYDKRLCSAGNSTQQKKTRNERKGAKDMNYMKT